MQNGESISHKKFLKLLKRCSKGDRKAQEHLYSTFYGYAMSIALRFANSFLMAEEITNDSFLKVFTKLDTHDTEKSFKAWLRQIVVNSALDYNRREMKNQNLVFTDQNIEESTDDSDLDLPDAETIIAALQTLSPVYRLVFNLYVMEGYSHDEIAAQLDVSVSTSRSNLARAKQKLKETVQKSKNYA